MNTFKRNVIGILCACIFSISSYGQQNYSVQKTAIKNLEKGLQKSDYTQFKNSLSGEFSAAAFKQPMVDKVIPQVLQQYPPLISLKTINIQKDFATVTYSFEGMDKETSKVFFDNKGKITKVEFFDAILGGAVAVRKKSEAKKINSFTTNFKLVNGLIFVKVKLNGVVENFILDSGAPAIILNSQYFKQNKSSKPTQGRGVSGNVAMRKIQIDSFDWNGIQFINTELIGVDLSHLEKDFNMKVKGLIGFKALQNYELFIDYKKQELSLFSEGKTKLHNDIKPMGELAFNYQGHIPVLETVINNKKYQFGIDTGAEGNLISIPSFETLPKSSYKITDDAVELEGGDKNVTEVTSIKINSCEIGSHKFNKMLFVSADISHLTKGYGLDIDGLVGYPFLSKHKISIDFLNKKIYFWE